MVIQGGTIAAVGVAFAQIPGRLLRLSSPNRRYCLKWVVEIHCTAVGVNARCHPLDRD